MCLGVWKPSPFLGKRERSAGCGFAVEGEVPLSAEVNSKSIGGTGREGSVRGLVSSTVGGDPPCPSERAAVVGGERDVTPEILLGLPRSSRERGRTLVG